MFESILSTTTETTLSVGSSILSIFTALILGIIISIFYMITTKKKGYSNSFAVCLVLLPAIVAIIIMLVGSNIASAFSIAGAFSLVRFRSAPGDGKDIVGVFYAMAIGLAAGMGFLTFAAVATLIIGFVMIILDKVNFGKKSSIEKQLKITIPEDFNYQGVFEDLFETYANEHQLERVRTTNLGTLYELTYKVYMKPDINEKEFMDSIRCRNGNLNIVLGIMPQNQLQSL